MVKGVLLAFVFKKVTHSLMNYFSGLIYCFNLFFFFTCELYKILFPFPSIYSPPISFGISFSQKPLCFLSRLSACSNKLQKNELLEKEEHLLSCTHQHDNRACTGLLRLSTETGWCQAHGCSWLSHAAAE